jgi:hypothetical protein
VPLFGSVATSGIGMKGEVRGSNHRQRPPAPSSD